MKTGWLRFLAWLNYGNARRRLGGIKAAETRKLNRPWGAGVAANAAPDVLSVQQEAPK